MLRIWRQWFPLREQDNGTGQAAGTPAAGSEGQGQPAAGEGQGGQQPLWRGTASGEAIAEGGQGEGQGEAQGQGQGQPAAGEGQGAGEGKPVVGHGGQPMSQEAIADRVQRDRRKWLRENFGTEDEAEAKKQMDQLRAERTARAQEQEELKRFRDAEEKRKREAMTREQRLQADLESERKRREELEGRLRGMEEDQLVSKQDLIVREEALRHVDERYVKYANRDLADHYRGLSEDDQKKFGQPQLKKFMRDWAKDNPAMSRKAEGNGAGNGNGAGQAQGQGQEGQAQQQQQRKPVPRRAPMATSRANPAKGSPSAASANGPDTVAGKTIRPGQANSMTRAELNEHFKQTYGRSKPW